MAYIANLDSIGSRVESETALISIGV
jgi:hypothetical protein